MKKQFKRYAIYVAISVALGILIDNWYTPAYWTGILVAEIISISDE